jgi:hypothetical protein
MPRITALGKRWRSVEPGWLRFWFKVFCRKARSLPWFGRNVMKSERRAAPKV